MRAHPGSGSGRIKHDGSDKNTLCEIKDASKHFGLRLSYVSSLFKTAVRQGKEPLLIIKFPGYECEIRITRKD